MVKKTVSNFPRLHIFLGAGGVGKTTLSAAFAIALASEGKKVALLSVDPAKRLQTALGLETLPELGHSIPVGKGIVTAALLIPGESLRRWVVETAPNKKTEERLLANPFFIALADKLATATDTLAAIRMAEWVERDSELTDFVIDTAPGIHAIDFLAKPEKLMAFFDSKLIEWLKWFLEEGNTKRGVLQKMVRTGAKKVLDGLAQIGGQNMLLSFAEFIVLLDEVILRMMRRLDYARAWLKTPGTDLLLVTSVRNDAAAVANHLGKALRNIGLVPRASIVNRALNLSTFSDEAMLSFEQDLRRSSGSANKEEYQSFLNYLTGTINIQKRMVRELAEFSHCVVELPIMPNLDQNEGLRLTDLETLGLTARNAIERN